MAQIHSKSSPLGDLDNKVPQYPSTIPRTIPCLEADTQTFLPLNMPASKSTPRSSRSPNRKLPFRTPSSSSRSRSPNQPQDFDSNYVFGPSREANSTEASSDQRLSFRPRCLQAWDTSSPYTNTPSSSGLSQPLTPPSYTTASKQREEPAQQTTEEGTEEGKFCVDAGDTRAASSTSPLPETICEPEDLSNDPDCGTDEETYSEPEFDLESNLVWRDDVEGFEEKVLQAVGDRKLAACLIPHLYISLRKERSAAVGSWSFNSKQCAGDSGLPHQSNSPTRITSGESSGGNSKKRQSRQDGSDDELGENQDGNNEGGGEQNSKRARTESTDVVRFACPFYKWKPEKYNAFYASKKVGHSRYGACQGPGFTSIGRLKDHLERVHLHVQCITCAQVFSGKPEDRVADLEVHQLAPEQCQLNSQREALREGISSKQWVRIARVIKNVNNSQGGRPAKSKTNVDKWMEIWDILFSNEARPETPWYDVPEPSSPTAIAKFTSEYSNYFDDLVGQMDNEEKEQFDGTASDEHTKSRFREIAKGAFQRWYTKRVVEQGALLGPRRDPNANDIHGASSAPNSSVVTSEATMNLGARQIPLGARQGMSVKWAGKQRAASNPENLNSRGARSLQSPAYDSASISNSFQTPPDGSEVLALEDGFDSFPFVPPASATSVSQDFQFDQMGTGGRGAFPTGAPATPQTGVFGSYAPLQTVSHSGNSFSGMPTYSSRYNQDTPSGATHPRQNNPNPQFNVSQYQNNHMQSTYAANQTISPDSSNFSISPTSHRPVNLSNSDSSGYPNCVQGGMNGLYWTENPANGN